jgi:hypothetical protein
MPGRNDNGQAVTRWRTAPPAPSGHRGERSARLHDDGGDETLDQSPARGPDATPAREAGRHSPPAPGSRRRARHVRKDRIVLLRQGCVLRLLPVPAVEGLALRLRRSRFEAQTDVFRKGDHGDDFYVIESCRVAVIDDGQETRRLRRPLPHLQRHLRRSGQTRSRCHLQAGRPCRHRRRASPLRTHRA